MRLKLLSLIVLLCIGGVFSNWSLTFSEEFNNLTKLNTSVWNTYYSFTGTINSELEYYVLDAFEFSETDLQIVQNNIPIYATNGSANVVFNYTSGVMTTKHKYTQTYGYFEMRAQVPQGLGFWPAFWLLPETDNAVLEIDIMEMIMNEPDTVYTTFHCNYSTGGATGSSYTFTNFSTGYHIFGLQWYPNNLIWYVDGLEVFNMSSPCVPNVPEYIITNVAIGGVWPEPPNNSTPFPSYMNIDYIRAYEYVSTGGISIEGPGAGVAYTPNYGAPIPIDIWNPIVTPETANPGDTVVLSFDLVVNSNQDLSDLIFQFPVATYTENLNSWTMTGVSVAAGSPTVLSLKTTYTIPSNLEDSYIKIGVGVFSSTWSNLFWESDIWALGVNLIVGA